MLLEKQYNMGTDIKLLLNDDTNFPPSGDPLDVCGDGKYQILRQN